MTDFRPGDSVYGCIGGILDLGGTLGEYVRSIPKLLANVLQNLSFWEAAALPLVGITAYQAVFGKVAIAAGQKVLVYGSTGGVGHFIVQMAKLRGAEFTTYR